MAPKLGVDDRTIAHQHEGELQVTGGHERPINDAAGAVIAAHRVDGDAHQAAAG
jgi:hypothetical protein